MRLVDLFQIFTLFISIYIAFTERKNRIYIATFMSNMGQLLMYRYNNDFTAMYVYFVITTRSLIYIKKDIFKTNIVPYVTVFLQLILGYFTIEEPVQILAVLIPCYSTLYLWFSKDTQALRIGNIVANTLWAIYNLIGGLYIIIIMRLINIISNLVAYIRRSIYLRTSINVKKETHAV